MGKHTFTRREGLIEQGKRKTRNLAVGAVALASVIGCGKDDPVPTPTPPTPEKNKIPVIEQISKESKLTFSQEEFNTEKLLTAIKQYLVDNKKIDDENPRGVRVELLTDVSQFTEGKTEVKFIVIDEKGQKSRPATLTVELLKSVEAISLSAEVDQLFPAKLEIHSVIDLSKVQAVDSKHTPIKPTKITVNGQEVQAGNYTLDQVGNIEFVFTFPEGYTPQTLTRVVRVNYKEAHYGAVDTRPSYAWLDIEVDDSPTYQSHSVARLRAGVEKNKEYGYFDAKLAIDALSPEWKAKVEQQLRKDKIGRLSSASDQYFESDEIEDSGNDGKYDDHDETQLRNFLGENRVALTGNFDLGPRNGDYLMRAINDRFSGIKEIEQYHLKKLIYSVCGEASVKDSWTAEDRNKTLDKRQPFADKLASGEVEVYVIMSNRASELVTREEAHAPEGVGKLVNFLTFWLHANPESAKGITVVTFDRTGSSDTNSYFSPKLMQLLTAKGGKVYYAPALMSMLGDDYQSPDHYTPNMLAESNNNSYGSVRYMADLTMAKTFEQLGVRFPFKHFKDSKGAGYGQMLEYDKIDDVLFGFDELSSVVYLPHKPTFTFRSILPQGMVERYGANLRINTPWGWVGVDDDISVDVLKSYDLGQGFMLGVQIGDKGIRTVYTRKPQLQ